MYSSQIQNPIFLIKKKVNRYNKSPLANSKGRLHFIYNFFLSGKNLIFTDYYIFKVKSAKKSYGQHFLVHESTAQAIAGFLDHLPSAANVLEIGPGRGMMTKYLLPKDINFRAVEADIDMVKYLDEKYNISGKKMIHLDFLKLNLSKVFDNQEFTIIGNFPYNISSQIVFKMLNSKELVPEMIGMFQKEVAERIISPPGSKDYGVISILTQAFYEGEMLMKLGPEAFSPPPKVNSAVIRLTRKKKSDIVYNERLFRILVKSSFNQRRKMLRNTLKPLLIDPDVLSDDFFNQRPEQLSVEQFISLTIKLENNIKNEPRD
jgi:16S rRNA (adenine1518-N6/adenine1519-N6)-dimethyltransferase